MTEDGEKGGNELAVVEGEEVSQRLSSERSEIVSKAIVASTGKELNDLTRLFNANLAKAEMVRAGRQSDLLDKVIEQAGKRIEGKPDALTDKDLLGYMGAFQAGLDKSRESVNREVQAAPTVLVQHSEVNLNVGTSDLDRDSKERVIDAVKSILGQLRAERTTPQGKEAPIEAKAVEVEAVDKETNDG